MICCGSIESHVATGCQGDAVQFPLGFRFFSAVTARRRTRRLCNAYITAITTTKISALSAGHGQGCRRQFGARNEDLVGGPRTRDRALLLLNRLRGDLRYGHKCQDSN